MNECECGADKQETLYLVDGEQMTWRQLKDLVHAPESIRPILPAHDLTCPAIRDQYQFNIFEENHGT